MTTQLAVLGSPIAHSKSPALHDAAYGVLGLDWRYGAVDVTERGLSKFVTGLDDSWRGLSLTMPLKRDILPLLDETDPVAALTGAANTVALAGGTRRGFNTDVYGITRAFRDAGVDRLDSVWILGGGATAASVLVAVQQLGAREITLLVRSPTKASALVDLAEALGVCLGVRPLDSSLPSAIPDAVISTLPGHAEHSIRLPADLRRRSVLFDVAYSPWPSEFATDWYSENGTVISGLDMLINQALAQVRIFVSGDPATELDNEPAVLAAMRAAVGS